MPMKDSSLRSWAVVTADQRNSRRSPDRVPDALAALAADPVVAFALPFERTAGDEIQGLTDSPDAVVATVLTLTRLPNWHLGIGLGPVEEPLPTSTREARGPAYLAARRAVDEARNAPANLRLIAAGVDADVATAATVGADPYGDRRTQWAEAALVLLRALVSRRTPEGWEIMDVLDEAGSGKAAARTLGISPSAVSQRLGRAARSESRMGAELARGLLAEAMGVES